MNGISRRDTFPSVTRSSSAADVSIAAVPRMLPLRDIEEDFTRVAPDTCAGMPRRFRPARRPPALSGRERPPDRFRRHTLARQHPRSHPVFFAEQAEEQVLAA